MSSSGVLTSQKIRRFHATHKGPAWFMKLQCFLWFKCSYTLYFLSFSPASPPKFVVPTIGISYLKLYDKHENKFRKNVCAQKKIKYVKPYCAHFSFRASTWSSKRASPSRTFGTRAIFNQSSLHFLIKSGHTVIFNRLSVARETLHPLRER